MSAGLVIKDVDILAAGYEIKTSSNEATIQKGYESRDPTVWGNNTRRVKAGLRTASMNIAGFFEAGQSPEEIDDILAQFADGQLVSIFPNLGTPGQAGHSMLTAKTDHQPVGGAVGDLAPFNVTFEPAGNILRPVSLHYATETSSDAGSSFQLGAVSAVQRITGILHVLEASGTAPTLDAVIRSDDNSGMSSPTTRITFPQQTAAGIAGFSVPAPVDGAIADDWWDVSFTIGGTSPSFKFLVGLYIGPKP